MPGSLNDVIFFADLVAGYKPAQIDANANGKTYFSFVNKHGEWYIMEQSVSGTVTTYQYFRGVKDYATSWGNRTTLSYSTFDVIFA